MTPAPEPLMLLAAFEDPNARPEVGSLAEAAYEQMAPVAVGDSDRGFHLLKFLHAYYLPLQLIDDVVRDRTVIVPRGVALRNRALNPRLALDAFGWQTSKSAGFVGDTSARAALPPLAGEGFAWHINATNPDATVRTTGSINPATQGESSPIMPSRQYTVIVDVYVASLAGAPQGRLNVRSLDSANGLIETSNGTLTNLGVGWQRIVRTYTTPSNATRLRVNPEFRFGASGDAVDAYITKLMVVRGDISIALPDYFDGDQENGRWQGEPHYSIAELLRMVESDAPGWSILFDPDLCPARYLPWLAMFAGVRIQPGMDEFILRERIKTRDGLRRGTPGALVNAAQEHLTGEQRVTLRERYYAVTPAVDAPGYVEVVTYQKDSPETDWKERRNLVPNPKAAVDLTGITGTGLTLLERATLGGSGHPDPSDELRELRVSTAVHATGDTDNDRVEWSFAVVNGKRYRASQYIRLKSPLTALGIRVNLMNSANVQKASSGTGPYSTLGEWTRIDIDFTADETGTWKWRMRQSGAGAANFYMTALMVEESDTLNGYADGDTHGWEWTGTPQASESRRIFTTILHDAMLEQKDAGLVLVSRIIAGQDWQQLVTDFASWTAVLAAYPTWQRVIDDEPI